MMATGSTEAAFSTSSQALPCFNSNLLKTDANKYWNGAQVLATTSTDGFWEDDPEEKIKKKVLASKSQFHMGRALQIKHLPRDVTEAEIQELLNDFPVQCIRVATSSAGSSIARAELEDPEMLEDWDRERSFLLRGQCVPVCPAATELMLCVARLPTDYTEDQFHTLVKSCGEVRRCFLMISEKTGESKGYGFVEYTTNEISIQAKNILDGKQINGWTLVCDWLDSSHITFESLHSKCLYVDCLPKNFRDMSEFRKIFSSIVNPPYCQIALKNGCPQDWGLVEYSNWEDAEAAQTSLNGYNLHGQKIRISYYIPGVRAINLYLKLLNDTGSSGRSAGLLPDPSGQAIMQNLQKLFKQNPIFAQNLQTIIASQIQAAQNGEPPPDSQKKGPSPQGSMQELRKSPSIPPPPPPPPKNGHHPPPPGPSPTQFLKPTPPPPSKIPLLPNPTMAPPPPQRRLSISPPAGEGAPPLPVAPPLEEEPSPNYWAGLLGQLQGAPPAPVSYPVPPPEPPGHPYNIPPPNFIRESPPNVPVDLHQSLISLLSNSQNLQQLLTNLHSMRQQPTPTPSPVPPPPPTFTYLQDPSWAQPLPHLTRSLLTSPIPIAMTPKHVNFMEMKPPGSHMFPAWAPTFLPPSPQPLFSPFGSPGILWSQSPALSPQPNPMMTPIGQKRRLLPSPEPSPEGNYIGQHSQGIGGHYADSYFKRKKKN
uniref:RRM domain-containing protein n=1 Tax=Graphocephala atropunctata TaxID=36148 RepID=A0A1B6LFJ0_9HEMI